MGKRPHSENGILKATLARFDGVLALLRDKKEVDIGRVHA
jgi:hypothetical protein